MSQITISGITGIPPYDVYICDTTFSFCSLISGSTTIPPNIDYTLSGVFENVSPVIIKIVDSNGCEFFEIIDCPPSPTPTPSITPTPTPTTTPGCHCISFQNTGTTTLNFGLIQCNNSTLNSVIYSGTTLYYCGSNPSGDTSVNIIVGGVCSGFSC